MEVDDEVDDGSNHNDDEESNNGDINDAFRFLLDMPVFHTLEEDMIPRNVSTAEFNDLLLQLANAARSEADEKDYETKIGQLVKTGCKNDSERWKTLVLTLLHKRYHVLSPEAKSKAKEDSDIDAAGQGERALFYNAVTRLYKEEVDSKAVNDKEAPAVNSDVYQGDDGNRLKALRVLVCLAPYAGGSRDVAALIESFVQTSLDRDYRFRNGNSALLQYSGKETLTHLVLFGVKAIQDRMDRETNEGDLPHSTSYATVLSDLLQLAADTLDHDLDLIRHHRTHKEENSITNKRQPKELPSTLHMFLPHRDRGSNSNKKRKRKPEIEKMRRERREELQKRMKSANPGEREDYEEQLSKISTKMFTHVPKRQVYNCVAELLIWSKTRHAKNHGAFSYHYGKLLAPPTATEHSFELHAAIKKHVHALQTIIRKEWRRTLNNFARANGFMLSDQYQLGRPLTLEMMNRGKAGDVSKLQALSKEKEDEARILRMLQLRFNRDPEKVTKYASLRELQQHAAKQASDDVNDEVAEIERDIHVARVVATASHLRKLVGPPNEKKKRVVIASMEPSIPNHAAAVLTAAALSSWEMSDDQTGETTQTMETDDDQPTKIDGGLPAVVKLLLGGTEHSIASFGEFLKVLDQVLFDTPDVDDAPSFVTADGHVTAKAVLNLLERHVKETNTTLLLVTSRDLALPQDILDEMGKRDCTIHCHDGDDLGERLLREKAKKGDVTISLAWDSEDDLDLHVFLPPRNEEVFYSKPTSSDGLCTLDVDMNASSPYSKEPVENVFCGDLELKKVAPLGLYKVVVENFGFHTSGSHDRKIPFTVVVEQNGKKTRYNCETKGGTGEVSRTKACEFEYRGRTIPFPGDEEAFTAFGASNLINVTSSSGQTLEALSLLAQTIQQHEKLEEAKRLLAEDKDEAPETPRRTARAEKLDLTNYDRLQLLLAKLPARFHMVVDEEFGGGRTLADHCAASLARRMLRDRIPLSELTNQGWPDDVVEAVEGQLHRALASKPN